MSEEPISNLRRRMLEDMAVRKFGDKTKHDYIRHIESFARFLGRSPACTTRGSCHTCSRPRRWAAPGSGTRPRPEVQGGLEHRLSEPARS
jgi:hypothetical protein